MHGNIEFSDITFSYPSREDIAVFSHLDLKVDQGSVLAIVGGSGSGKSTLAALLLRLYDPDSGMRHLCFSCSYIKRISCE